jgi:hypothetical protein
MIRNVAEDDYGQVASLCKEFFTTHEHFQRSPEEIINYLKSKSDELLVMEENDLIKGCVFLVSLSSGGHRRWRFRHFAFETEELGAQLLGEAERRIKEKSSTAKIELNIAETEQGKEFYLSHGYVQEGILMNHFRWGEKCFVLGKSLS